MSFGAGSGLDPRDPRHDPRLDRPSSPTGSCPRASCSSSTSATSSRPTWSTRCAAASSASSCCSSPRSTAEWAAATFDIYRVCERMARIDLGVATAVLATFLGSDPIVVGGTPEQKKHWMARIADEGLLMAYGATEPEAGSDLGALKTVAVPVDRGRRGRRLPHQRPQAVDLQRRRRRPLHRSWPTRPAGRRGSCVDRGHRRVRPRQAREQARHPRSATPPRCSSTMSRSTPTGSSAASRARGSSQAQQVFGYTRPDGRRLRPRRRLGGARPGDPLLGRAHPGRRRRCRRSRATRTS